MINQSVLEAKRNVLKSGRAKRILEADFEADRSGSEQIEAPFRRRSFGATWMWMELVESSGLESVLDSK